MGTEKILKGHKEIATFMGISISTLKRHLHLIPVTKMGGCTIVVQSQLVQWINRHSEVLKDKIGISGLQGDR